MALLHCTAEWDFFLVHTHTQMQAHTDVWTVTFPFSTQSSGGKQGAYSTVCTYS